MTRQLAGRLISAISILLETLDATAEQARWSDDHNQTMTTAPTSDILMLDHSSKPYTPSSAKKTT
jgi:hypothetical protein